MAATTFPADSGCAAPLALANPRALRQGSQVRADQQDAHSGLCHLDRGLPADVLRAVRHRAGADDPGNRGDNATYMLATMGCFGVMAVVAVRLRREPGDGARSRLAASEARLAHAGERLLSGEAVCGSRVQHGDHAAAADGGHRFRRSASARWRRLRSWLAFWSRDRSRSARWVWPSDTSPSRTRRRRWST